VPFNVGAAVQLRQLELQDVRVFAQARLDVEPNVLTVLIGPNGCGKTTILEAAAFLGSQRSFRTAARETMVRSGAERAIIRALCERETRPLVIEAEIDAGGPTRTLVNHRRASARAELADLVPTTVFSPEDLNVVQGPPARRREVLDAALRLVDRRAAEDLDTMERVLRQRAALLRQATGKLTPEVATTLDVWDERLVRAGSGVSAARRALLEELTPVVEDAYAALTTSPQARGPIAMAYRPGWEGELAEALLAHRTDDVRRGVSTTGPQRDEVLISVEGRDTRTRASQGEQRTVALALRLAVHRVVTARRGSAPLLLLDDVFSELDGDRCRALVRNLPEGQTLLTTAGTLPDAIRVSAVVDVGALGSRG